MFESVRAMLGQVVAGLEKEVARFKNRAFLDAAVALCAKVAFADGTVTDAEKQKMLDFMKIFPALKVFSAGEVVESWTNVTQFYSITVQFGNAEADKLIAQVTDHEARKTMIQLAIAIGASDGDFDDGEKEVVRQTIRAYGLNASEFGL